MAGRELAPGEALVEVEMFDGVVLCVPVRRSWWASLDADQSLGRTLELFFFCRRCELSRGVDARC